MNKEIEKAIMDAIPELNPNDPRSIHYKRTLNFNSKIYIDIINLVFRSILAYISIVLLRYINVRTTILVYVLLFWFLILKRLIILIVKLYQNMAPRKIREKCRFEPSCSNYTLRAIEKYPLAKAIGLSVKRIYTCSKKNGGGIEEI